MSTESDYTLIGSSMVYNVRLQRFTVIKEGEPIVVLLIPDKVQTTDEALKEKIKQYGYEK